MMETKLLSRSGSTRWMLWMTPAIAMIALLIGLALSPERALSQAACDDPGYATDYIIVKMKDGSSQEATERMKAINGEGREEILSPPNTWLVDLPAGRTVPESVALYESDPDVEYAEPDYKVYPEDCTSGAYLEATIEDSPDPVRVGDKLTYEITVQSQGPATAVDAAITTFVPENTVFVSSDFTNGSRQGVCPPEARQVIRCKIGHVEAGKSATLTVVVRPTQPGRVHNLVETAADNDDHAIVEINAYTTVLAPAYCTISGAAGNDSLVGTPGHDVICGFGGDDVITGRGGNDIVYGGDGADRITGGSGRDRLFGEGGSDRINARDSVKGNDLAHGGLGRDATFADRGDRVKQ